MLGVFGWGFVMVNEVGEKIAKAYGALPGRRRFSSVLRAELYALLMLLRHALPPLRIGIDNSTVVKGLAKGVVWSTCWKRPHADLWRQIWSILEDPFIDHQGFVVAKVKAHRGQKERRWSASIKSISWAAVMRMSWRSVAQKRRSRRAGRS